MIRERKLPTEKWFLFFSVEIRQQSTHPAAFQSVQGALESFAAPVMSGANHGAVKMPY